MDSGCKKKANLTKICHLYEGTVAHISPETKVSPTHRGGHGNDPPPKPQPPQSAFTSGGEKMHSFVSHL